MAIDSDKMIVIVGIVRTIIWYTDNNNSYDWKDILKGLFFFHCTYRSYYYLVRPRGYIMTAGTTGQA